jgi:uncharacterized protein (TIGR00661 family)
VKILYAIQGTGNGHLARAEEVIPVLSTYGKLDIFVSGAQADIVLPFRIKYKSKGLSFYFGKNGGVDLIKTFTKNSSKDVFKEISDFPVDKYDLVINDFEPISAWACKRKGIACVSLSHQSALLSPHSPKPTHYDPLGDWILKNYAPTSHHVGFHFSKFDQGIYTPIIRKAMRQTNATQGNHFTVYLPAYDDLKLVPVLLKLPQVRWHIFSKHARKSYHIGKLSVYPVNKEAFEASMTTSSGVLCGAGFETPAEALFLGKKLMVVPMKNQYEQYYNAAALKEIGVPILKNIKKKRVNDILQWIENSNPIRIEYPDVVEASVQDAIRLGTSSGK